jgi:hypothetical protein
MYLKKEHFKCKSCVRSVLSTYIKKAKETTISKECIFTYGCPSDCADPKGKTYKTKEGYKKYKNFYGYIPDVNKSGK